MADEKNRFLLIIEAPKEYGLGDIVSLICDLEAYDDQTIRSFLKNIRIKAIKEL